MSHPPVPPLSRARRLLYLATAAFFFLLAVLGILLPVVPATPFLLVTSYFLVRSFPSLNDRLLDAPYFGPILYDWQIRQGIKWSVKVQAIATVLVGWGFSMWFFPIPNWARAIMAVLVVIGIYVVMRIPPPRSDIADDTQGESTRQLSTGADLSDRQVGQTADPDDRHDGGSDKKPGPRLGRIRRGKIQRV